jgi:nicotinamidase-related amidase
MKKMKSAILIIDLQEGLFDGAGKPYDYANTINRINILTGLARERQLPVIFIQHEQADGPLQYNSNNWSLVSELNVEPSDYVVRKTTPNSFLRTNLDEILKKKNVNNLIICGYATEFCVDTTVRAAAAMPMDI